MKRLAAVGACSFALAWASFSSATGFSDMVGDDLHARDKTDVQLSGYFRTRAEVLNNLDLDRGLTPSGQPLFPVPAGDPTGQSLVYGDLRLRTDLAVYSLGGLVAVKARIDVLDNVAMGTETVGAPSAASTVKSPEGSFRVKRAWGEVATPVGVIAAGRMGSHWGLGMLANGGDCADCDSGDAQDRLAFVTPMLGHIFALAYDFTWIGPTAWRNDGVRLIGVAPSARVQSFTFAVMRFRDPLAIKRRTAAGKVTFDYGAYVSHRWQHDDAPTSWLPGTDAFTPAQVQYRGYTATAFDLWLRFIAPDVRIELEAAALLANVDQPSVLPGITMHQPVQSRQIGAALESEFGRADGPAGAGIDLGYASGDPAPGFGVKNDLTAPLPKAGDLDGAQIAVPSDARVDNFRFHSDYRVDRILFREIIGTVTDAFYVRPHARVTLAKAHTGTLVASVFGVASWAAFASSTPGGKSPLGIELDPTLTWKSRDGFSAALEYAVLFPLSGLDNPVARLPARPAQLARLRLMFHF